MITTRIQIFSKDKSAHCINKDHFKDGPNLNNTVFKIDKIIPTHAGILLYLLKAFVSKSPYEQKTKMCTYCSLNNCKKSDLVCLILELGKNTKLLLAFLENVGNNIGNKWL